MADELISRQQAKADIMVWAVSLRNPKLASIDDTLFILDNLPSVDAVEVVRCKDCKHGELNCNLQKKEYVVCELDEYLVWLPNGFCSYGERKEDNATD